jgi:hypothetical protein
MRKFVPLILCVVSGLQAADKTWPWAGSQKGDAVTVLLLGDILEDINIQQRAKPFR